MNLKRIKWLALLSVMALCGSCSKEESANLSSSLFSEEGLFSAWINSVAPPSTLVAGTPVTFSATYTKPSPCYSKAVIRTRITGFEMELMVLLHPPNPSAICPDVLVAENSNFQVMFPRAGTYTIRYKGTHGPASIQLSVN